MATITVRMTDDEKAALEELASDRGMTLSELMREQATGVLARGSQQTPHSDDLIQLTLKERLAFALRFRTLAKLHEGDEEGESEHWTRMAEIVESGYTAEYALMSYTFSEELPYSECRFVWDVLDMFTTLEASLERLPEAERVPFDDWECTFRGFDGNNESAYLSYARFLIQDDRWTSLAEAFGPQRESGNSHMPTLQRYREMLAAWNSIVRAKRTTGIPRPEDYYFNASELETVCEAGRLGKRGREAQSPT